MISKYLKALIESNNRIIIPDFGAFMIQDSPEGKQISFNDFLKFNDGLLVNQMIKTDKISKDQATAQVKDFIKAVEKSFTQKKPYHIEGVGFLSKDNHGNIKFETKIEDTKEQKPAATDVKPTIELATEPKKEEAPKAAKETAKEPVKKETPAKEEKKEEKKADPIAEKAKPSTTATTAKTAEAPKAEVKKEAPTKTATSATSQKTTAQKTTATKPKVATTSNNSNTTTIIVVIAAVLVLFIGGYFLLKAMGVIGGGKKPVPEVVQVPEPVVDTVAQDTITKDTIIEEPTVIDEPTVIEEPATEEPKFYLIGGSFKVVSNAERFNQKLIDEGYNSTIIVRNNGFNCVSYNGFMTWEEALAAWRDLKNANQQVWILVR